MAFNRNKNVDFASNASSFRRWMDNFMALDLKGCNLESFHLLIKATRMPTPNGFVSHKYQDNVNWEDIKCKRVASPFYNTILVMVGNLQNIL